MFTGQDHAERWRPGFGANRFDTRAEFVLNLLADFSPIKYGPAHATVSITKAVCCAS